MVGPGQGGCHCRSHRALPIASSGGGGWPSPRPGPELPACLPLELRSESHVRGPVLGPAAPRTWRLLAWLRGPGAALVGNLLPGSPALLWAALRRAFKARSLAGKCLKKARGLKGRPAPVKKPFVFSDLFSPFPPFPSALSLFISSSLRSSGTLRAGEGGVRHLLPQTY